MQDNRIAGDFGTGTDLAATGKRVRPWTASTLPRLLTNPERRQGGGYFRMAKVNPMHKDFRLRGDRFVWFKEFPLAVCVDRVLKSLAFSELSRILSSLLPDGLRDLPAVSITSSPIGNYPTKTPTYTSLANPDIGGLSR